MNKKNYKTILNKKYKVEEDNSIRIKALLFKTEQDRMNYLSKKYIDIFYGPGDRATTAIRYAKYYIQECKKAHKYKLLFDAKTVSVPHIVQEIVNICIDLYDEQMSRVYDEKIDTGVLGYKIMEDVIDGFDKNGYVFCSASNHEMLAYERE